MLIDAQKEKLAKLQEGFKGGSVSNEECLATIKAVLDEHGYLIDPHTAVAYAIAQRQRGDNPVLVASTAHWAKFGDNVYRALHGIAPGAPLPEDVAALTGCELNALIARETGQGFIPAGLAQLDELPVRFTEVIDRDEAAIEAAVEEMLCR